MKSKNEKIFQIVLNTIMIIISLGALFPFALLVFASFTAESEVIKNGYSLFPDALSLEAYKYIWAEKAQIGHAYLVTISVTGLGTLISLLISTLYAYALSRKDLPGRTFFSFYLFFTMLFNGGLVPTYLMYTEVFHIKNTIWALIIPGMLMNAFNVIMVRTYFQNNIPDALIESARIDGAGEYRIFFSIITPLAKPIMATILLFVAVAYWNDWINALYYISKPDLFSIQSLLNRMMRNIEYLTTNAGSSSNLSSQLAKLPRSGVRMAIAVVGILPILVFYPILQKNFIKGISVGAVKG